MQLTKISTRPGGLMVQDTGLSSRVILGSNPSRGTDGEFDSP